MENLREKVRRKVAGIHEAEDWMADVPRVGQSVIVRIPGHPEPVEARVRAVLDTTQGVKLIADFGHEQVATVPLRDIVRE